MVYNMVHDLWKNTAKKQVFFLVHTYTKSLDKERIEFIQINNLTTTQIQTNKNQNCYIYKI